MSVLSLQSGRRRFPGFQDPLDAVPAAQGDAAQVEEDEDDELDVLGSKAHPQTRNKPPFSRKPFAQAQGQK